MEEITKNEISNKHELTELILFNDLSINETALILKWVDIKSKLEILEDLSKHWTSKAIKSLRRVI